MTKPKTVPTTSIPLTINFDLNREAAGWVEATDNFIWRIWAANPNAFVIAPSFLVKEQDEYGNILDAELIGMSIVSAK